MATQFRAMSKELNAYLIDHSVREPAIAQELREKTNELAQGAWQTPAEQAQFMCLLANIANVNRVLEIGTFTGYMTLWLALCLPDNAEIVTCDVTDEFVQHGQPFWQRANVDHKIDCRLMPATKLLDQLLADGKSGSFDMAFIDADKENYLAYYQGCFELVRPGGLVLIDNVLWNGAVIDPDDQRRSTTAIRALNELIANQDGITSSIIAIGDGLTIVRKR